VDLDNLAKRMKNPKKDSVVLGVAYLVSNLIPNPIIFKEPFASYGIPAAVFVAEYNFKSISKVPAEPSYTIFWTGFVVNTIIWILIGSISVYTYRRLKGGDR